MKQDLHLEVTLKTTNTSSAVTINTNFSDKLFSICIVLSFIHSGVMKEEGNIWKGMLQPQKITHHNSHHISTLSLYMGTWMLGGKTQNTKYYHVPSSIYNAEASTNQHFGMQMHLQKSMHRTDTRRRAGDKKKNPHKNATDNNLEFWALTLLHRNKRKKKPTTKIKHAHLYLNLYLSLSKPRKAITSTHIVNYNLSLGILTMIEIWFTVVQIY